LKISTAFCVMRIRPPHQVMPSREIGILRAVSFEDFLMLK
jgi:hypothetical protein